MAQNNRLLQLLDELREIVTTPQSRGQSNALSSVEYAPTTNVLTQATVSIDPSNTTGGNVNRTPTNIGVFSSSSHINSTSGIRTLYPTTPSSILNEARRVMAPYSIGSSRGRVVGRTARRQEVVSRIWTRSFCCLSDKDDATAPDCGTLALLSSNGLGENVISFDFTGSSDYVRGILITTYPKLDNIDFEILKPVGINGRRRMLARVCSNQPIPSVEQMRTLRVQVLYVRPLTSLEITQPQMALPGQSSQSATQTTLPSNDLDGAETVAQGEAIGMEGDSNHDEIAEPLDSDAVTFEELRENTYAENPGTQYIAIKRDDILIRVLGLFKNPSFSFLKKPYVEFLGEAGSDAGAITKEFFWKSLTALYEERFEGRVPLFDGEIDHFLPSTDITLLQLKVFRYVGSLMAYAGLHCGISFIGLSQAVVDYILLSEVDGDTPVKITTEDIPDLELKNTIDKLFSWNSGSTINEEEINQLKEKVISCDYYGILEQSNARMVAEQIMLHEVIGKRKQQLDMIRDGFRHKKIVDLLDRLPFLASAIFPRSSSFKYTADFIISRLDQQCSFHHFDIVKNFIQNLNDLKLRDLVQAWIGWGSLSTERLKLKEDDDPNCEFAIHACFQEILIPKRYTEEELVSKLNLLLDMGVSGFGQI